MVVSRFVFVFCRSVWSTLRLCQGLCVSSADHNGARCGRVGVCVCLL